VLTFGQYGENSPAWACPAGLCAIGDRYRIGGAVFEVTQPRVTCYRVGIRIDESPMPALLVSHGRARFYFRVLEEEEEEVGSGDEITKVSAGAEQMTIAEIDALLLSPGSSFRQVATLVTDSRPESWLNK
jgi:MOSC domain-containing protein YiiM